MSSLSAARLFSVAGKVAIVTGGGRGIGAMIASALVQNGARVYVSSRRVEACAAVAADLNKNGPGTCIALGHDLSTEAGCKALAADVASREPALHILVNNSGTTWGEPLATYPDVAWDRVFAVNLKAPFTLTRACLPMLDKASTSDDPARVINIGSIAGLMPQPVPTYAYDASKAAVHMLTRKFATEFADRRAAGGSSITVNAIAPGFFPSKMSAQLRTYAAEDAMLRAIPLRRMGTPEDIGGTVLFLCGRAGAWTTGTIVTVDGGTTAKPFTMADGMH